MYRYISKLLTKFDKLEIFDSMNIFIFILAILYWLMASTCHLIVTDFLTDWVYTPWGKFIPRDSSLEIGVTVSLILFFYILIQTFTGKNKIKTLIYWVLTFSATWFSYRYLICAPIEIIHFPQYAILSILLAYSFDSKRKKLMMGNLLFWTTLMGTFDEGYQYFYVTKQFSHYFDFNDLILNEIGAVIGLMIFYGFRVDIFKKAELKNIFKSLELRISLSIILLLLIFNIVGIVHMHTSEKLETPINLDHNSVKISLEKLPNKFSHWEERDLGGYFYIVDPKLGIIFILMIGFIFSSFTFDIKEIQILRQKKSNSSV